MTLVTSLFLGYEMMSCWPYESFNTGSPLVLFDNNKFVQIGIFQGGLGSCNDKTFPSLFTRLEEQNVWEFIINTLEDKTEQGIVISTFCFSYIGTVLYNKS